MKRALALAAFAVISLSAVSARAQNIIADSRGCGLSPQPAGPNAALIVDPATGNLCTNATGGGGGGGGGTVNGSVPNNADGVNPTATNIGSNSYNYLFNGTSWDRWRGTTAGGALVNVTDFPSTYPSTVASGADVTEGTAADAAYAGSGSATVIAALKGIYAGLLAPTPAGTNVIGRVGIDQTTPGTTNATATYAKTAAGGQTEILADSTGALSPAGAAPAANPGIVSISASTATAIRASAVTNSIGTEIQTESANSAPIYICYQETTTCSATVHEDVIPVSTALGAKLIPLFNWTGTIYAYTTAATSVQVHTWTRN